MTSASARTIMNAQTSDRGTGSPIVYFVWFVSGAALGFLVPFIFTSLLSLHHDFYYLTYFAITLAFLGIFIRVTRTDLAGFFGHNWHWSLALGVLAAVAYETDVFLPPQTEAP